MRGVCGCKARGAVIEAPAFNPAYNIYSLFAATRTVVPFNQRFCDPDWPRRTLLDRVTSRKKPGLSKRPGFCSRLPSQPCYAGTGMSSRRASLIAQAGTGAGAACEGTRSAASELMSMCMAALSVSTTVRSTWAAVQSAY